MASYCLPRPLVAAFNSATASGGLLDPIKLKAMDSPTRRATIAQVIGEKDAAKVNSLFEEKLLLKYKHGLNDWVNEILAGPEDRKNIVDKISKIDQRILDPVNRQAFLEDLAASRLKTRVTEAQAKQIYQLAQQANQAKVDWENSLLQQVSYKDFMNTAARQVTGMSQPVIAAARDRVRYGNAVINLRDTLEDMKPNGKDFLSRALNVAAIPKTLLTGLLHFSAIGVQLWGVLPSELGHLLIWSKDKLTFNENPHTSGFIEQFKYFADEQNYKNLQAYIVSHPDYKYAVKAKLGLTDLSDKVINREESVPSSYPQEWNEYLKQNLGVPNVFRASSRAFTGYLNYVRFHSFVNLLEGLRNVRPEDVSEDSQLVKDAASVVNNFTGRANLGPGDKAAMLSPIMNSLFFAPRKAVATFQMFSPVEYMRLYYNAAKSGNAAVANQAARNIIGSLMLTGTILYLVNAAQPFGYSAQMNPIHADFGKIIGPNGEKYDFTGGNAIWLRLVSRLLDNREINKHNQMTDLGIGYKATTRAELAEQYLRGKLSPLTGAISDWIAGSTPTGQETTLEGEIEQNIRPIVFENFLNYYYNQPDKAATDFPVLLGMFGVNVESPLPSPSAEGFNFWGEPPTGVTELNRNELDKKMDTLGVYERLPPRTINGIKLTDDQYREYVQLTGALNRTRLGNLFDSKGFQKMPLARQRKMVTDYIKGNQRFIQGKIKAESLGGDNNIILKSMAAKRAKQGYE